MIIEDCKTTKKNLTKSWIDYMKAFKSLPHSWIFKTLELYKVSPEIIKFMEVSMKNWKKTLLLRHATGTLTSLLIEVKVAYFKEIRYPPFFSACLWPH